MTAKGPPASVLKAVLAILPLFAFACSQPDPDPPSGTRIKVLIAYSDRDTGRFDDYPRRIREAFAETQAVFANSNTGIVFDTAMERVPFIAEERAIDLERLVKRKDGHLDAIHAIRDRVEADIVVLISPLPGSTVNASFLATEATAFVIVAWEDFEAPNYGLAHEMAHLFGALHPGATGPVAEQFPQAYSWGNDSIKTVLDWSAGRTLPYFSGPGNLYRGTPLGDSATSDISSVIRITAAYISNFRGPITETDFIPKGTLTTLDYGE